jgi:hypothetical protein
MSVFVNWDDVPDVCRNVLLSPTIKMRWIRVIRRDVSVQLGARVAYH